MKLTLLIFIISFVIVREGVCQTMRRVEIPDTINIYKTPYPINQPFHSLRYNYDTLMDGNWLQFYESQGLQFKIARIWSTRKGNLHGSELVFDYNQNLERINYYEDEELFACVKFYESGSVKDSTSFLNEKIRYFQSWFTNGVVEHISSDSIDLYFYSNGISRLRKVYNDVGLISDELIYWNEEGKILYNDVWFNGSPQNEHLFSRLNNRIKYLIKFRGYSGK